MIDIIRRIGLFIINLEYTFIFLIILVLRKKRIYIPRANGEEIYLLMNGPSLSCALKKYSNKLANKNCMCVNMMANTDEYEIIKPRYYTIADIKFWKKMDGINENEFLLEEQQKWDSIIDNIVKKTTWKMYLFLPNLAKDNKRLVSILANNKFIYPIYLNSGVDFKGFDSARYYFWKRQLCVPELQNVLVLSIYVSVLMKYKKVYMLGCDHTFFGAFHVDNNNRFYYEYKHSYDLETVTKIPYDSYGKEYSVTKILKEYASLWETYGQLYVFSKKMGVNVFNCTDNSLIDVFPRIPIAEVFD